MSSNWREARYEDDCRNGLELRIALDEQGDVYVSVGPKGHKLMPTVRLCVSGGADHVDGLLPALRAAFEAIGSGHRHSAAVEKVRAALAAQPAPAPASGPPTTAHDTAETFATFARGYGPHGDDVDALVAEARRLDAAATPDPFVVSVRPWRDGTSIVIDVGPHQLFWHDYSVRDFGVDHATKVATEAAETLRRVLRALVEAARKEARALILDLARAGEALRHDLSDVLACADADQSLLTQAVRERDKALARAEELTRERDEARALTQAMHEDHERERARAESFESRLHDACSDLARLTNEADARLAGAIARARSAEYLAAPLSLDAALAECTRAANEAMNRPADEFDEWATTVAISCRHKSHGNSWCWAVVAAAILLAPRCPELAAMLEAK